MNDCLWFYINVCECNGDSDGGYECGQYVSVNSTIGQLVKSLYKEEVDEAIKPVTDRWKRTFLSASEEAGEQFEEFDV